MSTSTRRPSLVVAVGLAVLALAAARFPAWTAAPAPEGGRLPQSKLDELKKQLPTILQDEGVAPWLRGAEVRLVRQVGPEEVKVRVVAPIRDGQGRRLYIKDNYVIVRLRFYDGRWTTAGFEPSWPNDAAHEYLNIIAHRLMDLIDEATER
jgi:hypothetical protein